MANYFMMLNWHDPNTSERLFSSTALKSLQYIIPSAFPDLNSQWFPGFLPHPHSGRRHHPLPTSRHTGGLALCPRSSRTVWLSLAKGMQAEGKYAPSTWGILRATRQCPLFTIATTENLPDDGAPLVLGPQLRMVWSRASAPASPDGHVT